MNILQEIVAAKTLEISSLYAQHPTYTPPEPTECPPAESILFYRRLNEAHASGRRFFITEFKRKSPSEGWINREADLSAQVLAYAEAGASAISVLTDAPFFGGSYEDLKRAHQTLQSREWPVGRPLLLQKDFILDPVQIHAAKKNGADLILLIAAILSPERLDDLKRTAESQGLGVLVEVHDDNELEKIAHLDFPVLGINNRDLKTFRTALNRTNVLAARAKGRRVIAESGVLDERHFQMLRHRADGFLIGTGLMKNKPDKRQERGQTGLERHFQTQGKWLFKACGIRTAETWHHLLDNPLADFIGINFSPKSKRRPDDHTLAAIKNRPDPHAVAVFYQNTETEIWEVLAQFPFKTVQLYAGDVTPEFVRQLKVRVIMAVKTAAEQSWENTFEHSIQPYAADVDCFILDGARPGSGERIAAQIPEDFPYPFLLAGGIHEGNLADMRAWRHCIGVDIASGIETDGEVDLQKIARIGGWLKKANDYSSVP
ncbi:MAG: bifunctional indole-3-glycerol phosphate synthase/phosphoribosylanthranilate isomerase [Saprospiraceae bacterium]|nr:bifunctional indole-3-glycerol phosphate synthase/phosphoribosylanthranilate isomerase [Saprospiraceae bacterium]